MRRFGSSTSPATGRSGFAMILAITLLGLVGTALAVLATLFAMEARRTREQAAEAQLRQLLLAGITIATERAGAASTQPSDVPLPPEFAQPGAKLSVVAGGEKTCIEAAYGERKASQQVTFVRDGGKWRISTIETEGL